MSAINPTPSGKRLDSWKEIAAFFGRDERTVSRWEKEQGLPVHRLPGTKGRVYAYTDELTAWSAAPRNALAAVAEERLAVQTEAEAYGLTVVAGRREASEPMAVEGSTLAENAPDFHRTNIRVLTAVILGLGAIALRSFPIEPKPSFPERGPSRSSGSAESAGFRCSAGVDSRAQRRGRAALSQRAVLLEQAHSGRLEQSAGLLHAGGGARSRITRRLM